MRAKTSAASSSSVRASVSSFRASSGPTASSTRLSSTRASSSSSGGISNGGGAGGTTGSSTPPSSSTSASSRKASSSASKSASRMPSASAPNDAASAMSARSFASTDASSFSWRVASASASSPSSQSSPEPAPLTLKKEEKYDACALAPTRAARHSTSTRSVRAGRRIVARILDEWFSPLLSPSTPLRRREALARRRRLKPMLAQTSNTVFSDFLPAISPPAARPRKSDLTVVVPQAPRSGGTFPRAALKRQARRGSHRGFGRGCREAAARLASIAPAALVSAVASPLPGCPTDFRVF